MTARIYSFSDTVRATSVTTPNDHRSTGVVISLQPRKEMK